MALLISLAPALGTTVRATDFGFSEYTYATSNCTGVKDPLNLYYSYDLSTSLNMTQNILNWDTDFGSTQWFADTGFCDGMDRQRSTGILPPKWHTRLDWAGSFANITASPMHHDDPAPCGDVADSFNSARNHAKNIYQGAGYFVPYLHCEYVSEQAVRRSMDGW